jgi:hypothetical protein
MPFGLDLRTLRSTALRTFANLGLNSYICPLMPASRFCRETQAVLSQAKALSSFGGVAVASVVRRSGRATNPLRMGRIGGYLLG